MSREPSFRYRRALGRIIGCMTTPEVRFERELEVFRTEYEAATQFYFAFLAVHAVAYQHKSVETLLNRAPLFWNTCMGALQTSAFIALGRVFAHEPTPKDLRRRRAYVRKWRRLYETNYRDVRHQFFAHKEAADEADVSVLFSKGSNRELQRMLVFLGQLYRALWQMFFNSAKPVLRPARYSVARMRTQPAPPYMRGAVQETITREAEEFLKFAAAKLSGDKSQE